MSLSCHKMNYSSVQNKWNKRPQLLFSIKYLSLPLLPSPAHIRTPLTHSHTHTHTHTQEVHLRTLQNKCLQRSYNFCQDIALDFLHLFLNLWAHLGYLVTIGGKGVSFYYFHVGAVWLHYALHVETGIVQVYKVVILLWTYFKKFT